MRHFRDDISPLKHAGEDWFATEEYARAADIENPYTRAEVGREGDYYPPRGEGDAIYRKKRKR
jgi:hypothetical protein